ncbi:nucleotide-diphospho-sugar transferase [Powellomyces hirtus]|nr:nucleotide-diphospho-sugar transferase [Powellomyces hirtus]
MAQPHRRTVVWVFAVVLMLLAFTELLVGFSSRQKDRRDGCLLAGGLGDAKLGGRATEPSLATSLPNSQKGSSRKLAYVFYVTSDDYACACLSIIDSIKKVSEKRPDVDMVALVTTDVLQTLLEKLRNNSLRVDPVAAVATSTTDPTWRYSMTKNIVFNLAKFDRIIVLDCDGLVLRSLDFLFDLPSFPIYAPRAYWLPQPYFQSTFYVLEPSAAMYAAQRIFREASARGETVFDMDVANKAFADVAGLLPGSMAILNGDFQNSGAEISKSDQHLTINEAANKAYYVHFSESPGGGCEDETSAPSL